MSTTSTTGNGGSESHPFLQRRSCAASQHGRRELQTAQKPRARWRAVVGRQLGGKGVAYRVHGGGRRPISSGAAASCARAHPAPASAGMLGWGGQGVAGGAGSPTVQVLPTKLGWARGLYVRARSPSVLLTTAGSCPCSSALPSGAEAPRGSGVPPQSFLARLGYGMPAPVRMERCRLQAADRVDV